MKTVKMKVVLFTTTVLLAVSANTAFGQELVTIDENGNGSFSGLINGTTTGVLALEPVSGITNALRYLIGLPLVPGDVALFEDAASGLPSDILRFSPNPQNTSQTFLYFFSDKEATDVAPFDLADVDQMPTPVTGFVPLVEQGIEGQNGALYPASPGQIGSSPAFPTVTIQYNIISDIVPEPSGLALLSIGGGLLLLFRRRQHARN
jgi:hypothetical protein